jgi:hypothetical protein
MSTALSFAQLKSALWADSRAHVYAIVDGGLVPGLPAKVAAAECNGWDCLLRGALAPEVAATAPYLVDLAEKSPFTDWLLGEATAMHPGWGIAMVAHAALLATREHCRDLCMVTMPTGERRRWRWWDAELLALLLPTAQASQLDEVFGLGQQIVVPARAAWTWYRLEDGVLATDVRTQMQEKR